MDDLIGSVISKHFKNFTMTHGKSDYCIYDVKFIDTFYPYKLLPIVFTFNIIKDGDYDRVEIIRTGFEWAFSFHKLVGGNLTGSRQQVLDFIDINLARLCYMYNSKVQ